MKLINFVFLSALVILLVVCLPAHAQTRQLRRSRGRHQNFCENNPFDGTAFKCIEDNKYAWCDGDSQVSIGSCGRKHHLKCQCEEYTTENPCGSESAPANCPNDVKDGVCDGNKDDKIAFVCLEEDDNMYVECDGDDVVAYRPVPPGTVCQCDPLVLTKSAPFGNDDAESECRAIKHGMTGSH